MRTYDVEVRRTGKVIRGLDWIDAVHTAKTLSQTEPGQVQVFETRKPRAVYEAGAPKRSER